MCLDQDMLKKHGAVEWSPKKDIHELARVQRVATRWVPSLKDSNYDDRLNKINLSTLVERRKRGSATMLYNCVGNSDVRRNRFFD